MNNKAAIFKIKKIPHSLQSTSNEIRKIWERNEIVYFHAITLLKNQLKTVDKRDINLLFDSFLKNKTKLQIYSKANCSKKEIEFINNYFDTQLSLQQLVSGNGSVKEIIYSLAPFIHDCLKFYYESSVNKSVSIDKFDDYCFNSSQSLINIKAEEHLIDNIIESTQGIIDYRSIANYLIEQKAKSGN